LTYRSGCSFLFKVDDPTHPKSFLTFIFSIAKDALFMLEFSLYIFIGAIAGFLNTVAGGGTLITLPVLIFMGLPASVANATSRVGILTQNIFAVGGFHSKGVKLPFPYAAYLCVASLVGGFIGARMAVTVPDELFKKIISVIMVLAVLSIVFEKKKRLMPGEELLNAKRQVFGFMGFLALGIYGGFIQAGIGFLVIALLTHLHHFDLVRTNYMKVFSAIVYTAVSVATFAFADKIMWAPGLMLAVGHGFGAWYASRWSVTAGEKWIRRILVVTVVGLAVRLWFF
jgi:uncharacterized protein